MSLELLQRIERIERQMHNIALLGTVADTDYAHARIKVAMGDLVTGWLPWLTHRAGGDVTWDAPEMGEQVAVISPSGEIGNGFVIPAIYQNAYPANGNTPDMTRRDFSNGSYITHDRVSGNMDMHVTGDLTLTATGNVQITGARIDLN